MCDSGHPEDVELVTSYLQISDPFARKHILNLDLNEKKKKQETEEIKDEHKIFK